MIDPVIKDRVAKARVYIHYKGRRNGCGILVNGGYILTAAHCVSATSSEAVMAQIETKQDFLVSVETPSEKIIACETVAVECCADIAVLGRLSSYIPNPTEDQIKFDDFVGSVEPLTLCEAKPKIDVFVLTHTDTWVTGVIQGSFHKSKIRVGTDQLINHGTSGGPIVDPQGNLVSIASRAAPSSVLCTTKKSSEHPNLYESLPVWLLREIMAR